MNSVSDHVFYDNVHDIVCNRPFKTLLLSLVVPVIFFNGPLSLKRTALLVGGSRDRS
jgi:hypothetical protein